MRHTIILSVSLLAFALLVGRASAERPPQKREEATNVVTGVIKQIETKESPFGGDGVRTDYVAEIAVEKSDKGEGVKPGDTIKVTWFRVTKNPTKPIVGAFGHAYAAAKKGATVRVYLMKGKGDYTVIYNSEGMEAVK